MLFFFYCIFYLFERVKDPTSLFLYSSPAFWVVVAIIIYSAGTFFPFIYAQNYIDKPDFENEYKLIHSTLYIAKNLLFSAAMLCNDKSIKSPYPMNKKK
jgi:ABC-type dipeptide/oligopeptide/nickel transport system permease component